MSFDFRFTPPTLEELDYVPDYDCDHNCETCFWDCGDDEECQIVSSGYTQESTTKNAFVQ